MRGHFKNNISLALTYSAHQLLEITTKILMVVLFEMTWVDYVRILLENSLSVDLVLLIDLSKIRNTQVRP